MALVMRQSDGQGLLLLGTEAGSVGPLNSMGEVGGAAERRQSIRITSFVNPIGGTEQMPIL